MNLHSHSVVMFDQSLNRQHAGRTRVWLPDTLRGVLGRKVGSPILAMAH
jgi:hypothetical protein